MKKFLDVTEVDEYQIRIPQGPNTGHICSFTLGIFPIISSKYYTRDAEHCSSCDTSEEIPPQYSG